MKPVIYVVANKGLSMSPGKLAAQVGHAVAGSVLISSSGAELSWKESPHQWLIVLEAQDGEHLFWISEYLRSRSIGCHRVVDEGVNEVRPFSLTALGVEILDKDSPEAAYLGGLKKYYDDPPPDTEALYNESWNAAVHYIKSLPWYRRLRIRT